MAIVLIIFALLVVIWAIATCSSNEMEVDDLIDSLIDKNEQLKKELTILRNYIHFNNLECDVMAYYGRSDENRGKGE